MIAEARVRAGSALAMTAVLLGVLLSPPERVELAPWARIVALGVRRARFAQARHPPQ